MQTEFIVRFKKNRNDKGEIIVYSFPQAIEKAEEKKKEGYRKVSIKKIIKQRQRQEQVIKINYKHFPYFEGY